MPVTTGDKFPQSHEITAGLGADWNFPGNVYTANEPEDTSYAHVQLSAAAQAHDPIHYYAFALIAEQGGPIPNDPDVVIASVVCDFRLAVFNSTNSLDNVVGSMSGSVLKGSTHYATTGSVSAPARQNSGWVTRTVSWLGTIDNPQTQFTRADLSSTGANRLQCRLNASVLSGVTGNSNLRCAWIAFAVEWGIVRTRAGGAAAAGAGGATQRAVAVAVLGGGIRPASGGGARVTAAAVAGGGSSPRQGGGPRKTELAKAGGGLGAATGGGAASPAVAKAGGAGALPLGGGLRKAESRRAGGGIGVGASGAERKTVVVKSGGGAVGNPRGGGLQQTAVGKAGGGRIDALIGGGGARAEKHAFGGAAVLALGGGSRLVATLRAGGGTLVPVGGAERKTIIVKAGGGGVGNLGGGGAARAAIAKAGGAPAGPSGGGQRAADAAKAGGGALAGVGGLLQYSLYTFGISGFTRDQFGTLVPLSKVALVAVNPDGSYEVVAMGESDAVTGRYAFTTPSPASDPRPYWVSMHRPRAEGNIQGRTDEDLVPVATLVQGAE